MWVLINLKKYRPGVRVRGKVIVKKIMIIRNKKIINLICEKISLCKIKAR